MCSSLPGMPGACYLKFLGCLQAFVKARGDGLGYDLIKAEFHFDGGVSSNTASVWIDGEPQSRWATLPDEPTLVGTSRSRLSTGSDTGCCSNADRY